MNSITGTAYEVESTQLASTRAIASRVESMRSTGALTPEVLNKLRKYFRIKNIYHSNAIEGNTLDVGETRLVVEQGLTLTGRPLKDQAEAKNLSVALDFLEELAGNPDRQITEADVRQIHFLVLTGIDSANAGKYRTVPVEIGGSQFKPAGPESVSSEMDTFGAWLQEASVPGKTFSSDEAILAASAAHTWFVTIHPFVDGNGRVARLLMNLMLMRYGFPIAVISRDDRLRYYDALEISQSSDLTAFVALVSECLEESLEEYEAAAAEQREKIEWAKSIAAKFDHKEKVKASNSYEVWRSAMDLLKSLFRQTAELLSSSANLGDIYFRDFGGLEFEKYLSLKNHGSAKKTWFFRIDFRSGTSAARYLFFFGSPSYSMKREADVTLYISREEPPGSFYYERLDVISAPNVPNAMEIGYKADAEAFVVRGANNTLRQEKVDSLCRKFVQDVIEKHFGG
jgi:Fic family protein